MKPRRPDRGLTLLELVVATAIFALVAVLATQALTGGLIQRRGLERAEAEGAELMRLLSLLRQDLDSAVPQPHRPSGEAGGPALAPDAGGAGFAISRAGPGDLLQRVRWRIDPGAATLWRRAGPLVGAGDQGPEVAIAQGVTAIRVSPLGAWPDAPDGLPPGFEAVIESRRHGTIRMVVAR